MTTQHIFIDSLKNVWMWWENKSAATVLFHHVNKDQNLRR